MGLSKVSQMEHFKIAILQKCRIFETLSPEEIKEIASHAYLVFYKKKTVIFEEHQPANFFYAVYDGLAKIYKNTGSGNQVVFHVAGPGDTLNAIALTEGRYFVSTQALSNVTLLQIEREAYLTLLSAFPAISLRLISILAKRVDRECTRVVTILSEKVEQRLVMILYELFKKFGANIPLTRQELANCAGTSTETTIRVMSKLKKYGIIGRFPGQRGIVINDLARLEDLATEKEGWIFL